MAVRKLKVKRRVYAMKFSFYTLSSTDMSYHTRKEGK
jgi:hypothetical protein